MLMEFGHEFGGAVQFIDGVLVVVRRLLARGMRVLVQMGVLMSVRVDRSISMPVLMGMDVRVSMLVSDFRRHRVVLLFGR
jgi:hypothetical protein